MKIRLLLASAVAALAVAPAATAPAHATCGVARDVCTFACQRVHVLYPVCTVTR